MNVSISPNKEELGKLAAKKGAALMNEAIKAKGYATIIVATGASQFEMLQALLQEDIDWSKVEAFHLDEYIGVPVTHPASFRKYLKERFVDKVGNLKKFHYIEGDAKDLDGELDRLAKLMADKEVDVAFVGIGENAHLAFNDPPADFETREAYIVVKLDDACKRQQ
ncbi:MAG: 6-phosphogluconolactonase, partial [Sphaerochaeta sp.]